MALRHVEGDNTQQDPLQLSPYLLLLHMFILQVLMYGGPWADWPSFRDTTTTATGIASVAACYGMALIYTIKAPPKPAAAPKVKAQ